MARLPEKDLDVDKEQVRRQRVMLDAARRQGRGGTTLPLAARPDTVIYTALMGGYDELRAPQHPQGCDMVAFSDSAVHLYPWSFKLHGRKFKDPRRDARMIKARCHHFLPGYRRWIWIDANVMLMRPVIQLADEYLNEYDLAVCVHPGMPGHNCLYKEANVCRHMRLDQPEIIDVQINRYRTEGFPQRLGLGETNVLFRRLSQATVDFNELWHQEIAKGSRRDQLSFTYCLWKTGIKFCYINLNSRFNDFWVGLPHLVKNRSKLT